MSFYCNGRQFHTMAESSGSSGNPTHQQILSASQAGNAEEISKYKKSDVQNARDESVGLSPLHIAVIAGYENVVKVLLQLNTSHDSEGSGGSSNYNNFDFLHARTRKGHTAIHLAVLLGNDEEEILKLLIENYGKNKYRPNSEWDFADQYWMTPLHYAVLGNQTAHMKQLLEWRDYDRHVNGRDYFQRTPLHLASCHRPVSVEALLRHSNIDVNAKDCLLLTPLHWAVHFGRTDVVRCLVQPLSESSTRTMIHAVHRDIEDRSVLEIAMENSLLDLIPAVVSENLPCAPFQHDKLFLSDPDEIPAIHHKVNAEIVRLLLTCPDVRRETEDLHKNLGIYVNAVNAILVATTLIAGASIGMLDDFPDASESNFLYVFFFFKLLSFYGSVATVLAGVTVLRPLGKSVSIVRRVTYARSSLRKISWMLGVSLGFFVGAFYTENATHVSENKIFLIAYHVVSVVIIAVLCVALLIHFLRLDEHMKNILSEIEINREGMKILWEFFLMEKIFPLIFFLELRFESLRISADVIVERFVKSYRWSGRRSQTILKAKTLFTRYCASRARLFQDMNKDFQPSFTEIREKIEEGFGYAWKSTRKEHAHGERESGQKKNPEVGNSKVETPSFDCSQYWWRHGVSLHDEAWFKCIGKEIVGMDRAYKRLTMKRGEIGRHYKCFLESLPQGLLFWIDDWVKLWKKKFMIFYRGYIFERDSQIFQTGFDHVNTTRKNILEKKRNLHL